MVEQSTWGQPPRFGLIMQADTQVGILVIDVGAYTSRRRQKVTTGALRLFKLDY